VGRRGSESRDLEEIMIKQITGVWSPTGLILIVVAEDGSIWKLEPPGLAWVRVTETGLDL